MALGMMATGYRLASAKLLNCFCACVERSFTPPTSTGLTALFSKAAAAVTAASSERCRHARSPVSHTPKWAHFSMLHGQWHPRHWAVKLWTCGRREDPLTCAIMCRAQVEATLLRKQCPLHY